MSGHTVPPPRTVGSPIALGETVLLILGMTAVLGTCAFLIGGPTGLVMAAALGAAAAVTMPAVGPNTVMRWLGALPIEPWRAPELHEEARRLSRAAGLPAAPRLFWLGHSAINAFTVGSGRRAGIALSDGALRLLPPRELRAVLAHEIAHVMAGDTQLMRLSELLARLTQSISLIGLILSLVVSLLTGTLVLPLWAVAVLAGAPTLTMLLALTLSRRREFAADQGAAVLTGDPHGLAAALERIERMSARGWRTRLGASMEMMPSWARTHPPTEERVARLLDGMSSRPPAFGPGVSAQPVAVRIVRPRTRHRGW